MRRITTTPNARFISHLIKSNVSACLVTDRLIVLADHAYASRDKTALAHIGTQISKLSVSEGVGDFYLALALSQADRARADKVLESVAESSSPLYRARALLALGSHRQSDGDIIAALEFYQDAERLGGQNSLVRLYTGENRAIVESARGNHKSALAGFLGVQRYATGANLFNNLNSQAEELRLLGRHKEAARLSALCLNSPFASAYPEWQETATEIHLATRSRIYISTPILDTMARVVHNAPRALMRKDHYFVAPIELSTALRAAQFKFDEVLKRAGSVDEAKALSLHLEAIKELDYLTQLPEVTQYAKEMNDDD